MQSTIMAREVKLSWGTFLEGLEELELATRCCTSQQKEHDVQRDSLCMVMVRRTWKILVIAAPTHTLLIMETRIETHDISSAIENEEDERKKIGVTG